MTPHDHRVRVPGCYRCELGVDEALSTLAHTVEELEVAGEAMTRALAYVLPVLEDIPGLRDCVTVVKDALAMADQAGVLAGYPPKNDPDPPK